MDFICFPIDFIGFPVDFIGFPMDSIRFPMDVIRFPTDFIGFPMVFIEFPMDFTGCPWISLVSNGFHGFPMDLIGLDHDMASQRKCKVAWIMWAGGLPPQLFMGGSGLRGPPLESPSFVGGGKCRDTRPP